MVFQAEFATAIAKSLQLCLTLCNPMDCGPPGSSVYGIPRARILDWVAISSSRGIFPTQGLNTHFLHCQVGSLPLQLVKSLSRVQLFATPWTVAYQAPPSMGFSRPEYWSGVPLPSPVCYDRCWLSVEPSSFYLLCGHWCVSALPDLGTVSICLRIPHLIYCSFPYV